MAASSSKSSLSVSSLAPIGAVAAMLSPWGLSTLKALLLEPIRVNPPVWLRVLFGLLVVANIRSTPLLWHIRVWYPAIKAIVRARACFLTPKSQALSHKAIQPQLRLETLPIGKDIFEDMSSYSFLATLDECDWNSHLSNSSYSRSLDCARMAHNVPRFIKMFSDGGSVALGGSGFSFHREIPMLARYTIRMSVEAWDDKWLYLVGRFVSPAKPSSKKPAAAACSASTDAITEKLLPGETLYCTSTSRYVCKAGRRTIPPWLMIAASGYGTTSSNWQKAEKLRVYYLEKERKAYLEKTGKKSISAKADAKLRKKAPLLRQYRLQAERQGTEEEAWMDKSYWDLEEWETRRKQGLQRLLTSVGVLPPLEK